jgi:tetratricopeptide (TPR) repeat protein
MTRRARRQVQRLALGVAVVLIVLGATWSYFSTLPLLVQITAIVSLLSIFRLVEWFMVPPLVNGLTTEDIKRLDDVFNERWQKRLKEEAVAPNETARKDFVAAAEDLEKRGDQQSEIAFQELRDTGDATAAKRLYSDDLKLKLNESGDEVKKAARNLAALTRLDDSYGAAKYYELVTAIKPRIEDWIEFGDVSVEAGILAEAHHANLAEARRTCMEAVKLAQGGDSSQLTAARKRLDELLQNISAEARKEGKLPELLVKVTADLIRESRLPKAFAETITNMLKENNLPEALKPYRDLLESAQVHISSERDESELDSELDHSLNKLAKALENARSTYFNDARNAYVEAARIARQTSELPLLKDAQKKLAKLLNRIGGNHRLLGSLPDALEAYRECRNSRAELSKLEPENVEWQRELASSREEIGHILIDIGKLGEVLRDHRELSVAHSLARAHPDNMNWLRDRVISKAKFDVEKARFEAALSAHGSGISELVENFDEALAVEQYLPAGRRAALQETLGDVLAIQQDPRAKRAYEAAINVIDGGDHLNLATLHDKLGDVLIWDNDRDPARKKYAAALDLREKVANLGSGGQLELHEAIGDGCLLKSDFGGAATSYQQAIANAKQEGGGIELRYHLAVLHDKMGGCAVGG